MSAWKDFIERITNEIEAGLDRFTAPPGITDEPPASSPGKVMVCFVNRYMKPLDGVNYKIGFDGRELSGTTSEEHHCIELQPRTLNPVRVSVWSRQRQDYKALDPITPLPGHPVLVRKCLNTVKVLGRTTKPETPPAPAPRPRAPRPAPPPALPPDTSQGIRTIPSQRDELGNALFPAERPLPDRITVAQLRIIFPKNRGGAPTDEHLRAVADELNTDLPRYRLDTAFRRAHFFGQIKREAGPTLSGAAESLNYDASGLKSNFGYYKRHPHEAQTDGRGSTELGNGVRQNKPANQETIANKVYGTQGSGTTLGNIEPGDGWRFRGRGMKQITGRHNYAQFTRKYKEIWGNDLDFCAQPDLIAQMPFAIRSAVCFWLDKKCWQAADQGISDTAIDGVTQLVNRGEIVNHKNGAYKVDDINPVLLRRSYVKLSYSAFI